MDKTVAQAQADLEFLKSAKVEIVRKSDGPDATAEGSTTTLDDHTTATGQSEGKGKGAEVDPSSSDAQPGNSSLLDRISSSTTLLQNSLQTTFQNTIAAASSNPALSNPSQLRTQLAENLRLSSAKANLQLSVRQAERMAEEYLRKGDQLIKDAEKWMGDAVKVLPPDDPNTRFVATSWDGGDLYAFTTSSTPSDKVLFETDSRTPRPSTGAILAGSRKDALLTQLRQNKELLIVDPEGDDETPQRRAEFRSWVRDIWPVVNESGKAREIGNVGDVRMALGKTSPIVMTDSSSSGILVR